MKRLFMLFWIYVMPIPLAVAMYFAWMAWSKDRTFSMFVLLLPLFYGYVVPGIATNILHKWRFKGAWVVGGYYAHHGFMYAAKMSPLLLISFLGTPRQTPSLETSLRILLCTGALNGFVYWMNDIFMLRHGFVEIYNQPANEGRSPEEIVTHYAPFCFFLIGLTYAAAALLAFQLFVIEHKSDLATIGWVSAAGVGLMVAIPSLAYRVLERK
ncbi:MAG: hypothetical protein WCH99_15535 [Verrucomicrobiota bacterium]